MNRISNLTPTAGRPRGVRVLLVVAAISLLVIGQSVILGGGLLSIVPKGWQEYRRARESREATLAAQKRVQIVSGVIHEIDKVLKIVRDQIITWQQDNDPLFVVALPILWQVRWGMDTFIQDVGRPDFGRWEEFEPILKELDLTMNLLPKPQNCTGRRQENPYNIAICVYGSFRANRLTAYSFRRYVYNHLAHPDVILYISPISDPRMQSFQEDYVTMAKRSVMAKDLNYTTVREKGKYVPCLDSHTGKDYGWNAGWPTAPRPHGSELHQLHGAEQCGEIIKREEKLRGRKYDYVVFTRSDHVYRGPHPRIKDLPKGHVAIPSGEDWGGVNDRHSIVPRDIAELRFAIHEQLMNGTYGCSFYDQHEYLNAEAFIWLFYRNRGIPIYRYDSPQYLGCCQRHHVINNKDPEVCFRYVDEYLGALGNADKNRLLWAMKEFIGIVERTRKYCLDLTERP